MWYAKKNAHEVLLYINGKTKILPMERCKVIFYAENKFYLLNEQHIRCYDENFRFLFQTYTIEKSCNRLYAGQHIYLSSPDTGAIYQYSLNGTLLQSVRAGEHVCDFAVKEPEETVYTVSYHDNKIFQINQMKVEREAQLEQMPQKILYKNGVIYLLLNDAFYSYILQLNEEFKVLQKVKMPRQIGDLYWKNQRLVFCGYERNYILDRNLKILSIKKSTGKLLCRYSDELLYTGDTIFLFDAVNNLSYPL